MFFFVKKGYPRSAYLRGSWEYLWNHSHSFQCRDIPQMLSLAAHLSQPCIKEFADSPWVTKRTAHIEGEHFKNIFQFFLLLQNMINFETGVSKYQQKFKKLFNLQFVSEHSYLLKLSQTLQVCQRQSVFVTDGLYLRQCLSPTVPCQGGAGATLSLRPINISADYFIRNQAD